MTELKPYPSGYMKPPKKHRFKKGKSGNPRGRPKEPETPGSITLKVLKKKIRIKGTNQKVSLTEALALRLRDLAIQGYQPAVEILRELDSQRSNNHRNGPPEDDEARVIREMEEAGFRIIDGMFVLTDELAEETESDE